MIRKDKTQMICVAAAVAVAMTVSMPTWGQNIAGQLIVSGLDRPVSIAYVPGDFGRLFVVEQRGRVRIVDLTTNQLLSTPFLNIDGDVSNGFGGNGEQGMLGLAFHPDYDSNGWFFVNFNNNVGATVIRRYTVGVNPNIANPTSGVDVLTFSQPFSNHNGGWIGFSPTEEEGNLYISTGDGGSGNDPGNRAQDITNQRLGKLLRINVDSLPFTVPADNPFVGVTGDDEIWAYGLRNPWRCSFDRETGDLYIGDVGQNAWEEINFQPASSSGGENYGWRCMEGNSCTGLTGCTCNSPTLTDPIHVYSHPTGFSLTGGHVYRGCQIPGLWGEYFFADFVTTRIWSFNFSGTGTVPPSSVTDRVPELPGINTISTFGEDAAGELYIADRGSGTIWKIVADAEVADINANGTIKLDDALLLAADVLNGGPLDPGNCRTDVNGDGLWNGLDIDAWLDALP